jgi:predicted O-methyltransferase YrrM
MVAIKQFFRILQGKNKSESPDENDLRMLGGIKDIPCDVVNLRNASTIVLEDILVSDTLGESWQETCGNEVLKAIPDASRAVNPGDRRTLHYLLDYFRPKNVLEVGTHIGASTAWMSALLKKHMQSDGVPFQLTSVDVKDVNDEEVKYWLKFGSDCSPRERMSRLGVSEQVQFIAHDSLEFLEKTDKKFDFVFLDGNHRASHVYREIPLVLKRLNPNGVILLHDFCPEGKVLWPAEPVIIGPYKAVERHRDEGKKLLAKPLGALPWETKYGSHVTSLALMLREA